MVVLLSRGFKQSSMCFNALSSVTYGNKVVIVECAKLATPRVNMFCCLPLKTFNVESKCVCKVGNSKVVALRLEKTLSMTSITSSSIVDLR